MTNNAVMITIVINNLTNIPVLSGDATAHYSINGSPAITESITAPIGANATYNFTFFVKADLSYCDSTYNIVAWVDYPPDINTSNNTISLSVRNDCPIIPGLLTSDSTVCAGNNLGTLNLIGWQHGTITNWSSSIDGGLSWSVIPTTAGLTSYTYNNLTQANTQFRVNYDGGFCPDTNSKVAIIIAQSEPVGGSIIGTDSLCITNSSGTLNLTGYSPTILHWDYSIDGTNWNIIANTTSSNTYSSLTQSTYYRAEIDGGVCPNVYSDTFKVNISLLTNAGLLSTDSIFCESGSLHLGLSSYSGDVKHWQLSNNGTTWINTPNNLPQIDSLNTGNLTLSTYYRTIVKNGVCPSDTSNQVYINIVAPINTGTLFGGGSYCISNIGGNLTLLGNTGTILHWETSIDSGATWVNNLNNTNTENLAGLTNTTWFRILIDGGVCADKYSDTAKTIIYSLSNAGVLSSNSSICLGSADTLRLNNFNGNITNWLLSTDGITWSNLSNTNASYVIPTNQNSTFYSTVVQNGVCASDTSNSVFVNVDHPINSGNISGGNPLCEDNVVGSLILNGYNGNILHWEASIDSGTTWVNNSNATSMESLTGITTTTWYRVLLDGGACPDKYSDTSKVIIYSLSNAGLLLNDTTICQGSADTLKLTNYNGNVTSWLSSSDGITWSNITNTSSSYIIPSNQSSTYYSTIVKNGVCASDTSNNIFIKVDLPVQPGNISGSDSLCITNVNGQLVLNGNTGNILRWESSTDKGLTWSNITNSSSTESISGLTQSSWFRVYLDGGTCGNAYSDTATIYISKASDAGILSSDTTICQGEDITLNLNGITGKILNWYFSPTTGNAMIPLNITDSAYTINSVSDSAKYRVVVKNEVCPTDTSNIINVAVVPIPVANAGKDTTIVLGDSIILNGSGGLIASWLPDVSLSNINTYDPKAKPDQTTTYTLLVINQYGCYDQDEVTIKVGTPLSLLDAKNVITANNDGFNDTWIIDGINYFPKISVQVYNIYGNLVYESEHYQNDWKGDFKGKMLPNGTYLYVIKIEDIKEILKGNLTIMGNEE